MSDMARVSTCPKMHHKSPAPEDNKTSAIFFIFYWSLQYLSNVDCYLTITPNDLLEYTRPNFE